LVAVSPEKIKDKKKYFALFFRNIKKLILIKIKKFFGEKKNKDTREPFFLKNFSKNSKYYPV
jgi:hypothetical protein